jgi:hypothetical protein
VHQHHRGRRIVSQDPLQETKLFFTPSESSCVAGLGLRHEPIFDFALLPLGRIASAALRI